MRKVNLFFPLSFLLIVNFFILTSSYTSADIFAERIVKQNRLSVGSLDFNLLNSASNKPVSYFFHTPELNYGGYDIGAFKFNKLTDADFKYSIKILKTGGSDNLCNELNTKIFSKNLVSKFEGKLLDTNFMLDTKNEDSLDWIFFIFLEKDKLEAKNSICEFNLVFKTEKESGITGGIYAERILTNTVGRGNSN